MKNMNCGAGTTRNGATTWVVYCVVLNAFLCLSALGQYSIDWYKVAGGGGTSTSAVYSVSGTIGQPDAGPTLSGGSYAVTGGFWSLVSVVQAPGVPTLSIAHSGNSVIISWPYPSAGWALQQNPSVANPAGWQASAFPVATNSSVNSVNVTAPTGSLFFRLTK